MDIDKEAEKFGLKDKPIEIIFETEGTVLTVSATCDWCGHEETVDMTVFMADYTYEDCQADLLAGHKSWECKKADWPTRWWRFRQRAERKVLRFFRRTRTPWGIKHINWRPNVKR